MVHLTKSGLKFSRRTDKDVAFDQYEAGVPSYQNAIDLLPGWTGSFPDALKLKAGTLALHNDHRIAWMIKQMGSLEGKKVLEIGPLEGMHTYIIDQQKPDRVDAVEANRLCYLRCLITREILGMNQAHFHLGDAMAWLKEKQERYDLIVASGVLYHMAEPVELLRLMAERSDAVFIWTHYFPDVSEKTEPWRQAFSGKTETRELNGIPVRVYERGYFNASANASFCGGPKDRHYWVHREDILALLTSFGYGSIEIMGEERNHSGGPCFSLLAKRS